jgi:hypothetical protein
MLVDIGEFEHAVFCRRAGSNVIIIVPAFEHPLRACASGSWLGLLRFGSTDMVRFGAAVHFPSLG